MKPEPFSIEIPESAVKDMRERLSRARFAPDFENEGWRYGTKGSYLRELVEYWQGGYDWRRHEAVYTSDCNELKMQRKFDGAPGGSRIP